MWPVYISTVLPGPLFPYFIAPLAKQGPIFTNGEIKKYKDQEPLNGGAQMVILCFHRQEFQHFSPPLGAPGIPTSYSAYYNISVAKAELLNKLKDQPEMAEIGLGEEVDHELAQKKVTFFDMP